jgi:hypothetical protein
MRPQIIYTCGDSHTAGGETADDLIWPEQHPGFYALDQLHLRDESRLARWRLYRDRCLRRGDPVDWDAWQAAERQQAWPQHLGDQLGCEVRNGARIGSSMEWIARQTMTDVSQLLAHRHASTVMVMVQPSNFPRLQIHDPSQGGWTSCQLSDANGMDPHVHQWLNLRETDQSLATRWVLSMMGLLSWLRMCGVRTMLIDSGHTGRQHQLTQLQDQHLLRSYGDISDDLWHVRSMSDIATAVALPCCPDLHWTREVHQLLAEDLARSLA